MNIVADKSIPFVNDFFNSLGNLTLLDGKEISRSQLKETDVLVVRTITKVNQNLLEGTDVKFVATATSGYDHIDTEYLTSKGIGFAHAPGSNARSVAEYVLSSLFVVAEQMDFELNNKIVGIIGCGNVGSMLYSFLQSLGMECHVYDPPRQERGDDLEFSSLSEIKMADIISLHVPLETQGSYKTSNLIDSNFLSGIKSDVVFINTSRGGVVDESDLLNFINTNQYSSIVLDVWKNEPAINMELFNKVRISTSHIAGYSLDGKYNATKIIYKKTCERFNIDINQSDSQLLPDNEQKHIVLNEFYSEIDAVKMAVLASYDVRTDSAVLNQIKNIPAPKRASFFSDLRNNYPVRREYSSMKISLPDGNSSLKSKLEALGFKV